MNKDRVEGKMKDVAGRVERQAGEWTDNKNMQVRGTAKQAEGKIQNAVGKLKDAGKDALKPTDAEKEKAEKEKNDALESENARDRRHRAA
ncbi:MAG: CsbD family protein [Terriglobales bacterium]|jgi:uncharacterized protein YjbJ (UPF0337 family)